MNDVSNAFLNNAVAAQLFHAKICTYTPRFVEADVSLTKARLLDPLSVDPLHGRIALCLVSHDYAAALALTDHVNLHRLYRVDSLSVG